MRRGLLIANSQGGVLPQGYIQLNYLEGTGTQYIDTGVALSTTPDLFEISIDTDVYISAGDRGLCGNNGKGGSRFVVGVYNNKIYAFSGDGNNTYSSQYSTGYHRLAILAVYDKINGKKKLIVDNVEYSTNNQNGIANDVTIRVFNSISSETAWIINAKIYSFNMVADGVMLCNYIPALDPNGKPCMFDTVSQTPFYNVGTGEFLYG